MSDLLAQDVREAYAKTHSIFRVAKTFDITLEKVKDILGDYTPKVSKREAVYGGEGRPELRRYLIASKFVDEQWDNTDISIVDARQKYENGTHELATGRDGDMLLLYSIPRAKVQPRPNYFSVGYNQ